MTTAPFRHHVFFCLNQREPGAPLGCCASKNAEELFNACKSRVKEKGLSGVRINRAGCLDQCKLGPVVVDYPANAWFRLETLNDVEHFVDDYLAKGTPPKNLQLFVKP